MENRGIFRKIGMVVLVFILVWCIFRYFFPIIAPFLLGWIFAAAAEPVTRTISKKGHLSRVIAAGVSVTLVLTFLLGTVWLIGAVCYRELTALASGMPELAGTVESGMLSLRDWAVTLAGRMPGWLGETAAHTLSDLFREGGLLLDRVASGAISAAGNVAGKLPGGALMIGTAVISAYMISAQYPTLKKRLFGGERFRLRWAPVLERLRKTVGRWVTAQVKLTGVTFLIVTVGFLLLRVEHWLLWALVTAAVDAIPLLGTGTVLIPMAMIGLLKGEQVRAVGLLGLYVTAMLTRSALEPRLVGRQLGLNPLVTLMALYAGFQIWGLPGMVLSPILAVTAVQLVNTGE